VDLFEALSGIEGLAGELAAIRISAADLDGLRHLQSRIEQRCQARDRREYFRDNQALHEAIVRLSANFAIAEIHTRLIARVRGPRYQAIPSESRWAEALQENAHILAALESRDARRAGEVMRQHVTRTSEAVRASIDEQGE
jgi:DNA-binding GntR family transcriptional regulator